MDVYKLHGGIQVPLARLENINAWMHLCGFNNIYYIYERLPPLFAALHAKLPEWAVFSAARRVVLHAWQHRMFAQHIIKGAFQ